ncbi:hypothetical protein SCLCIDRAFT_11599 [Scleroderma citrinum Foug A]|uniref:DNAJ-containing protein X-domain domain-containing protein n=1 Tax=Scleroderma citrinum Foug A TaxID=1036808 RepID=A0A0C3CXN9_9AGAM|nr:hypothetical protein SCLCIDRAFT_11599 [Scleroderma citrinum Foug A]
MWETLYKAFEDNPEMPGLLTQVQITNGVIQHSLHVDQVNAHFLHTPTYPGIKLGDYGSWHHTDSSFQCEGNIFEDMKSSVMKSQVSMDPVDLALLPVKHEVSTDPMDSALLVKHNIQNCDPVITTYSTLDTLRCPTNPHTPLYTLQQPFVWYWQARPEAENMREFGMIRSGHQLLSITDGNCQGKDAKETAAMFFAEIFGVTHLRSHVGEITFFNQLHQIVGAIEVEASPESKDRFRNPDQSGAGSRQDRLTDIFLSAQSSLEIREEPQKVTNSRIERLAKLLLKGMPIVEPHGAHKVAPWFSETRKIARAAVAVSNSVGAGEPYMAPSDTITMVAGPGKCQKGRVTESILTVQDTDEQRALEEDIAGKILLVCYCGLQAEVEAVLAKVTDRILKDETANREVLRARAHLLEETGQIFEDALAEPPDEYQYHLLRVLADARAGTSKHALLLAAGAEKGAEKRRITDSAATVEI